MLFVLLLWRACPLFALRSFFFVEREMESTDIGSRVVGPHEPSTRNPVRSHIGMELNPHNGDCILAGLPWRGTCRNDATDIRRGRLDKASPRIRARQTVKSTFYVNIELYYMSLVARTNPTTHLTNTAGTTAVIWKVARAESKVRACLGLTARHALL